MDDLRKCSCLARREITYVTLGLLQDLHGFPNHWRTRCCPTTEELDLETWRHGIKISFWGVWRRDGFLSGFVTDTADECNNTSPLILTCKTDKKRKKRYWVKYSRTDLPFLSRHRTFILEFPWKPILLYPVQPCSQGQSGDSWQTDSKRLANHYDTETCSKSAKCNKTTHGPPVPARLSEFHMWCSPFKIVVY